MLSLATAAARNNVAWVDAVARSHGVATRCDGSAWRADGWMPPFYPNLVTLDPEVDARSLLADLPRGAAQGWGLKDSFARLDLTSEGFVPVFEAVWIARTIGAPAPAGAVRRVTTPEELDRWVSGWGETPPGAAIFLPTLLGLPGVRFYILEAQGDVTAGLAALVDDDVVGYSNAFGSESGIAACLGALAADASGRPLIGYERGEALAGTVALGFRPVASLRVWTSAPLPTPA